MTWIHSWYTLLLWSALYSPLLSAQVNSSDSLELVKLYDATDGAHWTQSWNLNQPVSTWQGVSVNPILNRVTILNLDNNNLVDTLPDLDLPQLANLVLSNNRLSGPLPTFANLPELRVLKLQRNQLTGTFPSFSANGNLETLELSQNNIQGPLPAALALPALMNLKLFDNQLSGPVPDFSNLGALTTLDLSRNNFSGTIPDFSNLPNLHTLHLSGNQLVAPIPDFSALPRLERLSLANNPFNSTFPTFSNLLNLRMLTLTECGLRGPMPSLAHMSNLGAILVSNNELTGEIPPLWRMPNMYQTDLKRNKFTSIAPIQNFSPYLQFVYYDENQLTFEDLLPVHPTLDSLTRLNNGLHTYNFQGKVGEADTIYVALGGSFTIDLNVDDTVTTNIYEWKLRGIQRAIVLGDNTLTVNNVNASDAGIYTCYVTNPNIGQRATLPMQLISRPVHIFLTNSSRSLLVPTFSLFPNPVNAILSIKEVPFVGDYTLRIFDLTGQVIVEQCYHIPQISFSVADLPAGHYTLQLIQEDESIQQHFIKR